MKRIVVDVGLVETRLAVVQQEELVELYIERSNQERLVGNIYKGKVTNVLPGMQAAFVDIGIEKNCFLYVKEALPQSEAYDQEIHHNISIGDVVKSGQEVIVQVTKESMGTKGPRVTTHLTLPGKYLVLMPETDYIGVSRRITVEAERERLRTEIAALRPPGMGIIIRTEAEGKTREDFQEDIEFLTRLWEKIQKEKLLGFAPKRLYQDLDLVNRMARDIFNRDVTEFIINDQDQYIRTKELVALLAPELTGRLRHVPDPDIFQDAQIEAQAAKAIARKVWLKSGGYLIFDATEALTVIDVNTGKFVGTTSLEDTFYKTNLEAAEEIAKQLRLRDIGGIIIIDFIDMSDKKYEAQVLHRLELAMASDRTKTRILGMTQLGLVEMTRKKVRDRLDSRLLQSCQCCGGTGRVLSDHLLLLKVEKQLLRVQAHTSCQGVVFELHPDAVDTLLAHGALLAEMAEKTGLKLFYHENRALQYEEINRKAIGGLEELKGYKTLV